MQNIYIIKYKETNTIEGFVKNREDFIKWLKLHNNERIRDGEIPEFINEFELVASKLLA